MKEKDSLEKYRNLFNMATERQVFEETLSLLRRATKAREVAEAVGRLAGVGGISSERVVTGDFINILRGVATGLEKGGSVNNIREQINSVIARDRWKAREKEHRETRPFIISGDKITVNFSVTLDSSKFALLQDIARQFNLALEKITVTHFDGHPDTAVPLFQVQGTPRQVSAVLYAVRERLGESALSDIRYISVAQRFERAHLTLLQALRLAENEDRL